jgi:hypothetical protein
MRKKQGHQIPVIMISGWNINLKELNMDEKKIGLIIHRPFDVRKV